MLKNSTFPIPRSILPADLRLLRKAKGGDVPAFLELSNPLMGQVYRYIHFLVPTNRIAEGLTLQVFFKAWERLADYPLFTSSFQNWIFSIAFDHINEYKHTHRSFRSSDNAVNTLARGGEFRRDHQLIRDSVRVLEIEQQHVLILKFVSGFSNKDIARVMGISPKHVRASVVASLRVFTASFEKGILPSLPADFDHVLESCLGRISRSASSLDDYLFLHPEFDPSLKPFFQSAALLHSGQDAKPFPAFDSYFNEALANYLRVRQRSFHISGAAIRRGAMAALILAFALLSTSTAYAQNAMPGDTFYSLKRASENIWLAVATNSTTVEIVLAERRLEEWLAVAGDPSLAEEAKQSYQAALERLMNDADEEDMDEVIAALQYQGQVLEQAGISNPVLDTFLSQVLEPSQPESMPQSQTPPLNVASPAAVTEPTDTVDSLEDECPNNCDMDIYLNPTNAGVADSEDADEVESAATPSASDVGKGKQGKGNGKDNNGKDNSDNGNGNNDKGNNGGVKEKYK